MSDRKRRRGALLGACLCAAPLIAGADDDAQSTGANPATIQELPAVNVVGTTPLPGLGIPLNRVPANVQSAGSKDIEQQKTLDLTDFMNQNLTGVNVNETAGNPYQSDVSFRGFTASPLLGTPEGLSVYVDGVRVNESFGDIVNWDLIPEAAIANITLMPGSNPVFGLNTLGGALSVQTKSGAQYPGTTLEAYGGSFGRRDAEFETGGSKGAFDYFLTGNYFDEDGWRDLSPSHVRQLFGKLGWENERTDVDVSYAWADTNLTGNGMTPESLLAQRRQAIFTAPDNTKNLLNFVNARASHFLRDDLLLAGNVYYRQVETRTYNGDVNDSYADNYAALIAPAGDCASAADQNSCAAAALADQTGVNNRSRTTQRIYGLTTQLTYNGDIVAHKNQLTAGASLDNGRSDFTQSEQDAVLTLQHTTIASGAAAAVTSLYGTDRTYGVFATDTFSISPLLHLTASARYNNTRVVLQDRLGSTLNGKHGFERVNPAFGANFTPRPSLTLYAAYNEGSRAPTPIELGCADPDQPCKLPNAFAADPALKQVVARTVEVGGRGSLLPRKLLRWSAAIYRTVNRDDIQFISSSFTGSGYFDNVGKTRRQGAELGLNGEVGHFKWHAGYSYVDATYRSRLSLVSDNNSTADDNGFIEVPAGSRLPLIARHTGKLVAEYDITGSWSVGANLLASSNQFDRGNENNQHMPGVNASGETFSGSGKIGGYAVLNLNSSYRFAQRWEAYCRINNVFDHRYASSAQLSANPFDASGQFRSNPDDWTKEPALSPAAPRAVWAGLRLHLD